MRICDLELQIPEAIRNAKVVDLTDASGSWNLNMLNKSVVNVVVVEHILGGKFDSEVLNFALTDVFSGYS